MKQTFKTRTRNLSLAQTTLVRSWLTVNFVQLLLTYSQGCGLGLDV